MTIYYVGIGGNDGSNGQSWTNRKLTLNGAEDIPVVAGDTVYVGPGTYREALICDVVGSSGSPITYIGDVTGAVTDGVGGEVRITGSDDDLVGTRNYCIDMNNYGSYRKFVGFKMDMAILQLARLDLPNGTGFYYCNFDVVAGLDEEGEGFTSATGMAGSDFELKNCILSVWATLRDWSNPADASFTMSNCFTTSGGHLDISGIPATITNCTFMNGYQATALGGGSEIVQYVRNCIYFHNYRPWYIAGAATVHIHSTNYCGYMQSSTAPTSLTNSNVWPALIEPIPLQLSGYKFPGTYGHLSAWSRMQNLAGDNEETEDFWGRTRPTASYKKSWGAIQFSDIHYQTGIKQTASASVETREPMREYAYIRARSPVMTVKVKVYREASYVGTLPQLVLHSPGTATRTITDTGNVTTWNQLELAIAAAGNDYILVDLVNNNTSSTGDYKVYWDDFEITH